MGGQPAVVRGHVSAGVEGCSRGYHSRRRRRQEISHSAGDSYVVLLASQDQLVSVLPASQDETEEPDASAGGRGGQGQAVGDQVGRGDLPHLCIRVCTIKHSRQPLGGSGDQGNQEQGKETVSRQIQNVMELYTHFTRLQKAALRLSCPGVHCAYLDTHIRVLFLV